MLDIIKDIWSESTFFELTWQQAILLSSAFLIIFGFIKRKTHAVLFIPMAIGIILVNTPGSVLTASALEQAYTLGDEKFVNQILELLNINIASVNIDAALVEEAYSLASPTRQEWIDVSISNAGFEEGQFNAIQNYLFSKPVIALIFVFCFGLVADFSLVFAYPRLILIALVSPLSVFLCLLGFAFFTGVSVPEIEMAHAFVYSLVLGDPLNSLYVHDYLAVDILPQLSAFICGVMLVMSVLQPLLMKLLTTQEERSLSIPTSNNVSEYSVVFILLMVLGCVALFFHSMLPLISVFCLGGLLQLSGFNSHINLAKKIVFLRSLMALLLFFLGTFINAENLLTYPMLILVGVGVISATSAVILGLIMAKLMNLFFKKSLNPLIGAASLSLTPMAAFLVNEEGLKETKNNFLLIPALTVSAITFIITILMSASFLAYLTRI
jgi:carboxybiotin decarboxylase